MRPPLLAFLAVLALSLAACGGSSSAPSQPSDSPASSSGSSSGGCLTPDQVDAKVNEIASGVETSDDQVAAKQQAIQAVRSRAC